MEYFLTITSPVGPLTLAQESQALTGLYFGERSSQGQEGPTPLLEEAARQLAEYFAGQRREFSLPLAPRDALPATGVAGPAGHPLWGNPQLRGNRPGYRQPQGLPGRGHG